MAERHSPEAVLSVPELRHPRISPSGRRVAFRSTESGRPAIWVADRKTGDVRHVTDSSGRSVAQWWLDESRLLVQEASQPSLRVVSIQGDDSKRTFAAERIREDTLPPWTDLSSSGRYLFAGRMTLDRIDLLTETSETVVDGRVAWLATSPTDEWIAFAGTDPETGDQPVVCWSRLDGSEFTVLTTDDGERVQGRVVDWHPTGDRFLFQTTDGPDAGVHSVVDDTTEWLSSLTAGDEDYLFNDDEVVGFFDEDHVLVNRSEGTLDTIPLSGRERSVTVSGESFQPWSNPAQFRIDTSGRGTAVVTTTATQDSPAQLRWLTAEESTAIHTAATDPVSPPDLSPVEREYEASDGTTASVEIYHTDSEPAPTVGVVYPRDSITQFPIAGQRGIDFLVRRGYTVVLSATPAQRYTAAVQDDHVAFGDWLCAQSWVDDGRIAVVGHSGGGHSVAQLLLTREEMPWQAGLMHNGVADLFAHDEHEETPNLRGALGDPADNRDAWLAQSPVEQTDNGLAAPLRIHHGVADSVVPVEQARTLRSRLLEAGHVEGDDFEYHELPNQGHVSDVVAQQARDLLMCVDFLDRRL